MATPTWTFPVNPHRKTVAFNNQGVAHFTGDRLRNVVREITQNSVDAGRNDGHPVRIELSYQAIPLCLFDGDGLLRTVRNCEKSSKIPQDAPILKRIANYLRDSRKTGNMETLVIADHHTTGAADISDPSMWEALTNSEGVDVKATPGSGGSHGIGKNAPYNISVPRAILYSTHFETENGSSRSLFVGRTLLVSHQDHHGTHYGHEGYLGAPDFMPLEDDAIDLFFRRDETGLTIYILGFTPEDTDWQTQARLAAIENFSHGIIRRKVEFDIDGELINAGNLSAKWTGWLPDLSTETLNRIRVSQSEPVAVCQIDGIGDVNLYMETSEDPSDNRREIALVRDAGMLITDQLRNMELPGMRRGSSLSRNLKGFTAVIECLSHREPSLIRDAEITNHTAIRVETIEDRERRRLAQRRLRELGGWVKKHIETIAKREVQARADSADELNQYVSLEGEGSGRR